MGAEALLATPKTVTNSFAVAYFSMEVGLDPAIPTYSGGLGVLAGDSLRSAADLGIPMVGVTLLYRNGYFHQRLDSQGNQFEDPVEWEPAQFLEPMTPQVMVTIEGRKVRVRAWCYRIQDMSNHVVPVYFLDTSVPENSPWDRTLTDRLYGGDDHYRLCQEVILGLGGIAMLRALGHKKVQAYHMNEGHSALLTLALLEEQTWTRGLGNATEADIEAVHKRCIFTTHTPVAAGHDKFDLGMVRRVIGDEATDFLVATGCCQEGVLNMTGLALSFSRYVNGVSMRHEEISRNMFVNYPVDSVTNGVHAASWASPSFSHLYDHYIPEWRRDNLYLRYAIGIPAEMIRQAHAQAKQSLLDEVERRTGLKLDRAVMTLGFARRTTAYKRADLLFSDIERLRRISRDVGPLQIIYAGKAHPRDEGGKALIRKVFQAGESLRNGVRVIYLEDYDMALARYLCAGVDLWLNTPQKPEEASGTSGMKAALNGVPSFSVLDGWWVEGHVEGVTGWSIGDSWDLASDRAREVASLYDKLEQTIAPMFYKRPEAYAEIMRSAIALNASFYNGQRMMIQYMQNAYLGNGRSHALLSLVNGRQA